MKPPSNRIPTSLFTPIKSASRQSGVRPIIGPDDEPTEPRYECRCGARYYGRKAAETCAAYHFFAAIDVDGQ